VKKEAKLSAREMPWIKKGNSGDFTVEEVVYGLPKASGFVRG